MTHPVDYKLENERWNFFTFFHNEIRIFPKITKITTVREFLMSGNSDLFIYLLDVNSIHPNIKELFNLLMIHMIRSMRLFVD